MRPKSEFEFVIRNSIASYMVQLSDVHKSVWVWYKDGLDLMAFYTSNYLSHFTEYEHNKELTQR